MWYMDAKPETITAILLPQRSYPRSKLIQRERSQENYKKMEPGHTRPKAYPNSEFYQWYDQMHSSGTKKICHSLFWGIKKIKTIRLVTERILLSSRAGMLKFDKRHFQTQCWLELHLLTQPLGLRNWIPRNGFVCQYMPKKLELQSWKDYGWTTLHH